MFIQDIGVKPRKEKEIKMRIGLRTSAISEHKECGKANKNALM